MSGGSRGAVACGQESNRAEGGAPGDHEVPQRSEMVTAYYVLGTG